MTDREKCKLVELIGGLKARQDILKHEIKLVNELHYRMESPYSQGYHQGRIDEMIRWKRWNVVFLIEVEQLLKGGGNANEETDLSL